MTRDKRTKRPAETRADSSKSSKRARKTIIKCFAQKYFEETLTQAGLQLLDTDEENEADTHQLDRDPLKFVECLKNVLENNVDYPRNVNEFVKGFDKWTADEEHLSSLLLPNKIVENSEDKSVSNEVISHPVLKLFLGIRCLQLPITKVLLSRISDFAAEANLEKVQLVLKPFFHLGNFSTEAESALVDGLSGLLAPSDHAVRQEIIFWLPSVVSQQRSHPVALRLSNLMTQNFDLTPSILDCLSSFSLSSDIKSQVEIEMLSVLHNMPMHFIPVFINYIFGKGTKDCSSETIRIVREKLTWNSEDRSVSDIESSQTLTALSLKTALSRSKALNLEWLKIINSVKESEDHNPLDIVILVIIYALGSKEKVETVFRKKIKASLFVCTLLDSTVKKFGPILKEHISDCLNLARCLLKSKNDQLIKEFSMYWFYVLFKNLTDTRKMIISELMHPEVREDTESFYNSITVLTKLAEENLSSFQPFSLQILSLVNKIEDLNIKEVSQLMNFICSLTFGIDALNLQDDIRMLIQKQCISDASIKIKGIVSAVMAVKHLACLKKEKEPITEFFSNIDDMPAGPAKDAVSIIQLILKSTLKFPEILIFFYDQFANMLNECKYIDGTFLSWLFMNFTQNFQECFITDLETCDLSSIDGLEFTNQCCLNEEGEVDEPIVLNIGNLVFREPSEKVELRILPSWFRVIQLIHLKCDENLTKIDALLGCGVIMPAVDDDLGLEEFDSKYSVKILNCYVYCINWFREIISAFSSQNEDTIIIKKTLDRLSNLVILEKKLALYLGKTTFEYKPPTSTFVLNKNKLSSLILKDIKPKKDSKKGKNTKKKTQNTSDGSITQSTTLPSQNDALVVNSQSVESKLILNKNAFRNISFEIISLISIDLHIENFSDASDNKISLNSLLFVLEEVNSKLFQIFPSKTARKFQIEESSAYFCDPLIALDQFFTLLPKLCQHIELINKYFEKLYESYDGVRDALGLFTDQNAVAQMCLSNIFQMFTHVFSWIGFSSHKHIDLFKKGLKIFVQIKKNSSTKLTSLKELIMETISYILQYKDSCLFISTAASLLKFVQVLSKFVDDNAISEELINISLEMLKQSWKNVYGDEEKGLVYNQHVNTVLSCYFSKPNIEMIKSLSNELCEQSSELPKKNFVSNSFQCINKSNFPLLFRSICHALYDVTKSKVDDRLTDRQHLELWKDVTTVMKCLTDILKMVDNRSNLLAFLKQSVPLLKLFLLQGMPIMSLKLKNDPDSVVEILKMLQHTTRFLHSLYCHSKLKKDTTLISHLPQMKFVLETLIYKVKAALNANNCSEVFWMGNLKNKNLQGELIQSQVTNETESDNEDQLPEDDRSLSESDLEDNSIDSDMKSVSSIF